MPRLDIETDDKQLLDDLVALEGRFVDAGVTVTRQEFADWLAAIDRVGETGAWASYEKKKVLLLIRCMAAVLRRLA